MPDLLVSTAVTAVLAAGMFTAISTLQRSAAAANHHVKSQLTQSRLLDYISRDLRRALTVNVDTYQGSARINLTIPDYYDVAGRPREAEILNGGINYGGEGVPVSYYKVGGTVFRSAREVKTTLATDVERFEINFADSGKQTVGVSITFVPRFQFNTANAASSREGTATHATTLLRNKRIQ
jgi:hypothetical protein